MAPKKKGEKMSLNAFLEDSNFGSWADEVEAKLPTAPAPKLDDESYRGDDFLASRPDRAPRAPREEVPLPTNPPFTAFVGNLAFDLTEGDLGSFFGTSETVKGAKIIRDRDEKPKGFGYVEFFNVDGLKDALTKDGSSFSHRQIRVNVAEPPKERPGFGHADDDKFAGSWRREGPLPDQGRDSSTRRRYDGLASEHGDSAPDQSSNWRSHRAPPRFETEAPPVRRRGSGFATPTYEGEASPADTEERWQIGSKLRASQAPDDQQKGRFGSTRGRGDMGPPSAADTEGTWRRPGPAGSSPSPSGSVPPTPQLGRRKLELLPRSTSGSSQPTPVTSPQSAGFTTHHKPNPFGAAKPVDVTAREQAAMEKIEREQEEIRERVAHHSMSRQSSKQPRGRPGNARGGEVGARSPSMTSATIADERAVPGSPRPAAGSVSPTVSVSASMSASAEASPSPVSAPLRASVSTAPTVRPTFSFAHAAAGKKDAPSDTTTTTTTAGSQTSEEKSTTVDTEAVAEELAKVSVQ